MLRSTKGVNSRKLPSTSDTFALLIYQQRYRKLPNYTTIFSRDFKCSAAVPIFEFAALT